MLRAVQAAQHRLWGQVRQLHLAVLAHRSVLALPGPPLDPVAPGLRPDLVLPGHLSRQTLLADRLDPACQAHPLGLRGPQYLEAPEDREAQLLL